MFLSELIIANYRSCKQLELIFHKNEPNIFIGINDCGKTTILKAAGLLLEDKPVFNSIKDSSSKKDFSNSPITIEGFTVLLAKRNLPPIPYSGNETIVIGKFIVEESDIDETDLTRYSNLFLWTIERASDNIIWLARIFNSNNTSFTTLLLTEDASQSGEEKGLELWNSTATDLTKKVKEKSISAEDIDNVNKAGRFSNLEKIRAIYSKSSLIKCWSNFKLEKGDKTSFPAFRYLDWNCSLDDIKKTATDAMAAKIELHIKPLKLQATDTARNVEEEINKQLESLKDSIGEMMPNITAIKTRVNINVQETVTDILINKVNGDGDIHIDLQGEGVKRQIWFALIKSGAIASIQSGMINKKFIWAFDEPETHLYPSAQRQFFEIIKDVSETNVQSFISTHSTVFIDKSKLKTIRSVALNEDSYTEYFECASVDTIFESLELRNSDFLFYDKFLVIEGDTESYLIPSLYKLYKGRSLEEDNIQLINLTGKNKWLDGKKALENVLKGFKKSFEYVVYLFDADMGFELGAEGKTDKMFFVGKQDIEDSIANNVWISFVEESTEKKVILTEQEIQDLKDAIPHNIEGAREQKFYRSLERLVKKKLSELNGEQVIGSVIPTKGNVSAQLLLKYIDSIDKVSPEIKSSFNKLTEKNVVNNLETEV
jgi:putative ATP-dependent endonuclease of the OLD family